MVVMLAVAFHAFDKLAGLRVDLTERVNHVLLTTTSLLSGNHHLLGVHLVLLRPGTSRPLNSSI